MRGAAGIAVDKLNRTGGGEARFVLTEELFNQEVARLESGLNVVSPNNARANRVADATDIDKSITQTREGWERKIRAEVTEELTGKDALGRVIDPQTLG